MWVMVVGDKALELARSQVTEHPLQRTEKLGFVLSTLLLTLHPSTLPRSITVPICQGNSILW